MEEVKKKRTYRRIDYIMNFEKRQEYYKQYYLNNKDKYKERYNENKDKLKAVSKDKTIKNNQVEAIIL